MEAVINHEDDPEDKKHDEERKWKSWKKGVTNPYSTEP